MNARTVRGHTPLIFAAGRGHDGTIEALLDAGASPRVIMANGQTARSYGSRLTDVVLRFLMRAAVFPMISVCG